MTFVQWFTHPKPWNDDRSPIPEGVELHPLGDDGGVWQLGSTRGRVRKPEVSRKLQVTHVGAQVGAIQRGVEHLKRKFLILGFRRKYLLLHL